MICLSDMSFYVPACERETSRCHLFIKRSKELNCAVYEKNVTDLLLPRTNSFRVEMPVRMKIGAPSPVLLYCYNGPIHDI